MIVPPRWRIKMTCSGAVHNGAWQTGIMFSTDTTGVPFQADLDAAAAVLGGMGAAFKTRFAALNASQCSWTTLRLDVYAPSSLAIALTSSFTLAPASVGSQTVESAPASSLVVTLNSVHPGRTGRGRMYWPMTGPYVVAATPAGLPAAQVSGIATDFSAYLTAINALGHVTSVGAMKAVIQSLKDGLLYDVTGVTVDGRPDRQEHRERRLTYVRTSHVVS